MSDSPSFLSASDLDDLAHRASGDLFPLLEPALRKALDQPDTESFTVRLEPQDAAEILGSSLHEHLDRTHSSWTEPEWDLSRDAFSSLVERSRIKIPAFDSLFDQALDQAELIDADADRSEIESLLIDALWDRAVDEGLHYLTIMEPRLEGEIGAQANLSYELPFIELDEEGAWIPQFHAESDWLDFLSSVGSSPAQLLNTLAQLHPAAFAHLLSEPTPDELSRVWTRYLSGPARADLAAGRLSDSDLSRLDLITFARHRELGFELPFPRGFADPEALASMLGDQLLSSGPHLDVEILFALEADDAQRISQLRERLPARAALCGSSSMDSLLEIHSPSLYLGDSSDPLELRAPFMIELDQLHFSSSSHEGSLRASFEPHRESAFLAESLGWALLGHETSDPEKAERLASDLLASLSSLPPGERDAAARSLWERALSSRSERSVSMPSPDSASLERAEQALLRAHSLLAPHLGPIQTELDSSALLALLQSRDASRAGPPELCWAPIWRFDFLERARACGPDFFERTSESGHGALGLALARLDFSLFSDLCSLAASLGEPAIRAAARLDETSSLPFLASKAAHRDPKAFTDALLSAPESISTPLLLHPRGPFMALINARHWDQAARLIPLIGSLFEGPADRPFILLALTDSALPFIEQAAASGWSLDATSSRDPNGLRLIHQTRSLAVASRLIELGASAASSSNGALAGQSLSDSDRARLEALILAREASAGSSGVARARSRSL